MDTACSPRILLHVHMEISQRMQAWQSAAQPGAVGLVQPPQPAVALYRPYVGIAAGLRPYHTADYLTAAVREVLAEAAAGGAIYVEFYFNLERWLEAGLSSDETFLAMAVGQQQAKAEWGLDSHSILCLRRDFAVPLVERLIDAVCRTTAPRPVGVTLAGDEQKYPLCREFKAAFAVARQHGLGITIHAGEQSGPETIWFALEELGAQRIGHGLSALQDPALMRHLVAQPILLEISLTSNQWSGAVPDLRQHPLKQFVAAGIPVSLNTDNPLLLGTTLDQEYAIARTVCGLSVADLWQSNRNAIACSFAPPALKQALLDQHAQGGL